MCKPRLVKLTEICCALFLPNWSIADQVSQWKARGVLFSYMPETHPLTGTVKFECEDEGHVFKVRPHFTVNCTWKQLLLHLPFIMQRNAQRIRNGGPREIQVEHFIEVVHIPHTSVLNFIGPVWREESV